MNTRKRTLSAQLPATPCTPEMRERLVRIANHAGVSIAETQRVIVSIFLLNADRNTNTNVREDNIQ